MESELLKIFDEQGNVIGTAPRSEVHKAGHWHETFHCWFSERVYGKDYLYFQIRSAGKKDYPALLDITAAGHILADETSEDGLREVKEELGVELGFKDLISLGVIKDSLTSTAFIDNERCHVYIYDKNVPFEKYNLQAEEVSGIVKAEISEFEKLWFGSATNLDVSGFQIDKNGRRAPLILKVNKTHFVPHEDEYIAKVIAGIKRIVK